MKAVHLYLNFDGNTEEAFEFYRSAFRTGPVELLRYRDFGDHGMGVAEKDLDKVAHAALSLGDGTLLMATDVVDSMPTKLRVGNNFYIMLEVESGEEAERLFAALAEGGSAEMPLQPTEWAEKYGISVDRFGVQWMISYTGAVEFDPDRPAG